MDEAVATTIPGLRVGRYLRVAIRDNGHGIAAPTLKRIFEPFFTTKPKGQGTGLGLFIVHNIMRDHDGAVTVQSEVGRGTVFHLYFPEVPVGSTSPEIGS